MGGLPSNNDAALQGRRSAARASTSWHAAADDAHERFTADLEWLTEEGVDVQRAHLTEDPGAFEAEPVVAGERAAHTEPPPSRASMTDPTPSLYGTRRRRAAKRLARRVPEGSSSG